MLRQLVAGIWIAVGLCGCVAQERLVRPVPKIDGKLDEAVWEQPPSRRLQQPQDRADAGRILSEQGTVRFFYADGTLYLAGEFDDSIIVTSGKKDGDDLYHGDCCEVFIKPVGQPFYWEIWVSPAGLRSVVKWRKKDDLELQGHLLAGREVQAATRIVEGSGWMVEAALPLPDIPGLEQETWEILIARQNYDESLSKKTRELSSFPRLLKSSFHRHEEYFKLSSVEFKQGNKHGSND